MARGTDHYKTLGVDKKASQEDIKKAYRKLARQYHPDTNKDAGAEERFKSISEAYDILGDPDKRKKYDRGGSVFAGSEPVRRRRRAGGGATAADFGSFSDILSGIFNTGGGRTRTKPVSERGKDLETTVTLSFEQATEGAQVPVSVATHAACTTCRGSGARPGHLAQGLPGLQRPRRRGPGPGRVLDHPPVLALQRHRHRDRGPVPDVRRRGPAARGQALPGQHPGGRARGLADQARGQGRGRPARRPGRRPVRRHPRDRVAGVQAQGRPLRGRGPDHRRRGARRRRGRGPDAQRDQEAAGRAGHQARHGPAAARRRPADPVRFRPGRPALSLRDRDAVRAHVGAARGRRGALEGHERQPARADPAGGRSV